MAANIIEMNILFNRNVERRGTMATKKYVIMFNHSAISQSCTNRPMPGIGSPARSQSEYASASAKMRRRHKANVDGEGKHG